MAKKKTAPAGKPAPKPVKPNKVRPSLRRDITEVVLRRADNHPSVRRFGELLLSYLPSSILDAGRVEED